MLVGGVNGGVALEDDGFEDRDDGAELELLGVLPLCGSLEEFVERLSSEDVFERGSHHDRNGPLG